MLNIIINCLETYLSDCLSFFLFLIIGIKIIITNNFYVNLILRNDNYFE